jgi:BirA family biotin operon repressor/biotin-[acetyl-CoA-carboxylase] ligase
MFDEASVAERLASTRFGPLRYSVETDSTNDEAAAVLGHPAATGVLFVAEYQRHGRGRRGRRWVAPPGTSLLFTAVLPRAIDTTALWAVPFWAALAVAEGIQGAALLIVDLQWPNDVLFDGRKVCGILSTSRVAGATAWAACGIGINVHRPTDAGADIDPGAAFLDDSAPGITREEVLVAVVRALDDGLDALDHPQDVARAWERRAGLPGAPYRIQVDGEPEPFQCTAEGLAPDGSLIIKVDGKTRTVALADARALR